MTQGALESRAPLAEKLKSSSNAPPAANIKSDTREPQVVKINDSYCYFILTELILTCMKWISTIFGRNKISITFDFWKKKHFDEMNMRNYFFIVD